MSVVAGAARDRIWLPRDPLVGARRGEQILVDLLDARDRLIRPLGTVEGGSLDFSIHTAVRSSGDLEVANPGKVDWHRHRLGVRYEFTDEAGELHSHPLGVFLPTTPATQHSDVGPAATVEIYDKMTLLETDEVPATWTADKGKTIVQAVADVLATIGETRVLGPDDGGGSLAEAMVWEPSTSKLRIVNDILEAGNFFSIWVDGDGVWRLDPYVAPTARGIAWEHIEGANAVFDAAFTHEADSYSIPNQVIIVGRPERNEDGTEEAPPVGVAENNNPDDPLSIPSRGRVISHREDDQDATSEQVLGQIAARRLLELSSVTSTYRIEHAWLPVDLNAGVRLVAPSAGVDALCVLQAWSWSWDAGEPPGLVSSTLREVRS